MSDDGQQYTGGFSTGGQQGGQQKDGQQGGQQPVDPVPPAAPPATPVQPVQATPVAPAAPPAPPVQPVQATPVAPAPPAASASGGLPQAGGGGFTPPAGGGAQGGARPAGPPKPPFDPNYRFGNIMKTFTTTVKLPANELTFDEDKFLNLLAGSISLTKDEKKKIVDSMPKLRQAQVDELMRIFTEEREKFVELSQKHGAQLKKLEDEHIADWRDIEMIYKQETQTQEDDSKADDIRKQLGL